MLVRSQHALGATDIAHPIGHFDHEMVLTERQRITSADLSGYAAAVVMAVSTASSPAPNLMALPSLPS